MALNQRKYEHEHEAILRDIRPLSVRIADGLTSTSYSTAMFMVAAAAIYINDWALAFADLIVLIMLIYFIWLLSRDRTLAFKLPIYSKYKDGNNGRGNKKGDAEGILYLGNVEKTNEEVWFTNSDIRTHFLYLGTTGAGKTEGLKSLVTNAMSWGSGFVYVDGKADTDLWSSLSSLVRRFGRDDDLLVLNYMTGNADIQAPSNTMNPFSSGSASYLTNMLVSLMPDGGGDNAMWKERAVSLVGSMMPVLTWKRDHQEIPMSVRTIRDYLSLNKIIKLSRDEAVPAEILAGIKGYLDTLPGFIGDAYDDEGNVKPPGPDTPQYNTETASQQHGYLAMQFTRSLQSLGDDYGYIFDTQAADVDMVDVVLNRRILVVLVPALEKSGDEVANLGKIVSASIKGMMGSALGSTVEGTSETAIENKPTHSSTPFMTVFDEVGYYVAEGMAVMAAQARSLGFSLVFAGQDLPAMKKRVREEAQSITANCNIKLFGKLEDPTETKDFFEKTVGSAMVTEVSGFQMSGGGDLGSYHDSKQASVQLRPRASYDGLRAFKEGQAVITFGETVVDCAVFYSNPGFAKAMRVTRFMTLPPPDDSIIKHANDITKLRDLMVNKTWTAMRCDVAVETSDEIAALNDGFVNNNKPGVDPVDAGIAALVQLHALSGDIPPPSEEKPATNPATATKAEPKATTAPSTTKTVTEKTANKSARSNSKPPIFDSKPTEENTSAPEKTPAKQETIKPAVTETQKPEVKSGSSAKPAIFGGSIGAGAQSAKAQETDDNSNSENQVEKIKGNAESNTKEEITSATQTQINKEQKEPSAATASTKAKPAIFGSTAPQKEEPLSEEESSKPKESDNNTADTAKEENIAATPPKTTEEEPSKKETTDVATNEPAIFAANKVTKTPAQETSDVQEDTTPNAEKTTSTDTQVPAQKEQPVTAPPSTEKTEESANDTPKKPMIFGAPAKKSNDENEE